MALDAQAKRMAAAGVGRPWMRATFPTGTIDAEERASIGNTYGGNVFAAAVYRMAEGMFKYVAAEHSSLVSFYLEVMHRARVGTVYSHLAVWAAPYDPLTLVAVPGSELSTTSATDLRQRTAALTLTDGEEYVVQTGKIGSDIGVLKSGKVIAI